MLKRIVGLALIAAAGVIVWLWLRRRQDDFATMNTQFAPPDLSIRFQPPSAAVVVPAMTGASQAPTSQPELPLGEHAPPQAQTALAEPIPTPDELDRLFEDAEAPQPPAAPTPDALPATGADEADAAASAIKEPAAPADDSATESTPDANEEQLEGISGYCVRCKTKRQIVDAHEETTESGRRAARGTCPVCGANMFTFLKEEPEDDEPRAESQ